MHSHFIKNRKAPSSHIRARQWFLLYPPCLYCRVRLWSDGRWRLVRYLVMTQTVTTRDQCLSLHPVQVFRALTSCRLIGVSSRQLQHLAGRFMCDARPLRHVDSDTASSSHLETEPLYPPYNKKKCARDEDQRRNPDT